jgi:hypothetical protein
MTTKEFSFKFDEALHALFMEDIEIEQKVKKITEYISNLTPEHRRAHGFYESGCGDLYD